MATKKIYVHFGEDFTCKVVVEESAPFSDVMVVRCPELRILLALAHHINE